MTKMTGARNKGPSASNFAFFKEYPTTLKSLSQQINLKKTPQNKATAIESLLSFLYHKYIDEKKKNSMDKYSSLGSKSCHALIIVGKQQM
jgi:hypothetical protein